MVADDLTNGRLQPSAVSNHLDAHADRLPVVMGIDQGTGAKSTQRTIEIIRRVDHRQMGEGLREVALLLSGLADLLSGQSNVIGVGEHLLEGDPCFIEPARSSQRLDTVKVPSCPRSPSGLASGS